MPVNVRLRLLLRGLAKLTAVIVMAGAAGVALGIGLSALTDGDSTRGTADRSTGTGTSTSGETAAPTATASVPKTTAGPVQQATTTKQTTDRRRPGAGRVRVQVVSTVLHRGLTPVGRRRNRARLAVHLRVVNEGKRTIANVRPLLVAGATVRADRSAGDAGSLRRPVAPGSTADGTLRFETAGAVTRRLVGTSRAQLRIAGRTVGLTVQIGSPMRSGS